MTESPPFQNLQPSKNALTHGFYSADIVLSWENQQEFDDLLRAFKDEYCPDGVSEEIAVFDLASLHWKKRRLEAGLKQAFEKQRDFDTRTDDWDLADTAKAQTNAAKQLCSIILKHAAQLLEPDKAKAGPDQAKADSQAADVDKLIILAKEVNIVGTGFVVPSLQIAEKMKLDQIERAYQPHIMEKESKIQAEIDKRIEKVLRRLVMAKEYKRTYGARSAYANQIEAPKLAASRPGNPTEPET